MTDTRLDEYVDVNVVAFQDAGQWVAQCVEFDIAARADSLAALKRAFERAVAANLCVNLEMGRSGFDGIPPAPAEFRRMFDASEVSVRPTKPDRRTRRDVRIRDVRVAA